MKREIKFRGIYVDTGEFVYGYLLGSSESNHIDYGNKMVIFDPAGIGTYYVVKAETVGQCVGRNDKSGKGIYEGEIFNCIYHSDGCVNHVFVVSYSSEASMFYLSRRGDHCQQPAVRQTIGDVARYCSIGNIHVNPELLK